MIDWLRRERLDPHIALGGREVPIVIRRHPRARRMILRLAPDGSEVRLTLPQWGRTADAIGFAETRREWLEEQLARLPVAAPPVAGGTLPYRGCEVAIRWEADAPRRARLADDSIRIGGPEENLVPRLQRWLEGEALRLMGLDLADYCAAAGQDLPALRLSRAKQRWGSCSGKGVVRINWRLIQAPDPIRRSVVAHEVAHLVHFDHSPEFHALLGTIYEADIREANLWLKQHGRGLYTRFG